MSFQTWPPFPTIKVKQVNCTLVPWPVYPEVGSISGVMIVLWRRRSVKVFSHLYLVNGEITIGCCRTNLFFIRGMTSNHTGLRFYEKTDWTVCAEGSNAIGWFHPSKFYVFSFFGPHQVTRLWGWDSVFLFGLGNILMMYVSVAVMWLGIKGWMSNWWCVK